MTVQFTTKHAFISFFVLLLTISGCSPVRTYENLQDPNFTLDVGNLNSSFLSSSRVDLHIHFNPNKKFNPKECKPEGDDWYQGSIRKVKANQKKSAHLPIKKRVYLYINYMSGSITEMIPLAMEPKMGVSYTLKYSQDEFSYRTRLVAMKDGKTWEPKTYEVRLCNEMISN